MFVSVADGACGGPILRVLRVIAGGYECADASEEAGVSKGCAERAARFRAKRGIASRSCARARSGTAVKDGRSPPRQRS